MQDKYSIPSIFNINTRRVADIVLNSLREGTRFQCSSEEYFTGSTENAFVAHPITFIGRIHSHYHCFNLGTLKFKVSNDERRKILKILKKDIYNMIG